MTVTPPKIDKREALAYAGIRARVAIGQFGQMIPGSLDDTLAWLAGRGIQPDGPPLIRYHSCPTVPGADAEVDVCVGWPVPAALAAEGRFVTGILPAGPYASLVFTGAGDGVAGNGVLIDWARGRGLAWDSWEVPGGEGFAGRVEHLLDGPEDDPDPANWRAEVAILLAEGTPWES